MPRHDPHNLPDPTMTALFAAMTPQQRLSVVDRLTRGVRDLATAGVRQLHPEWSDLDVRAAVSRNMLESKNDDKPLH